MDSKVTQSPKVEDLVIGRSIKTKILERISSGSYGKIHHGIFLNTGERVAVKLEPMKMPYAQVLSEGNIMRHLEGAPGIPKIFWFGSHEPYYNCMVLDLLGPNLQELFSYCHHKFSLKTVLLIVDQVLDTFEYMHKKEYTHRDIKPDNFAIGALGTPKEHKICLFDFGLSKKFRSKRYSITSLSPSSLGSPIVGTVRYMGTHTHNGSGCLPRDDLESFAYCLVYFLCGSLPWQGIKGCESRDAKLLKIKSIKCTTTPEALCSALPQEFTDLVKACRNSRSVSDPAVSAAKWKKLFRSLATETKIEYDSEYDWVVQKQEKKDEYPVHLPDHGHSSS